MPPTVPSHVLQTMREYYCQRADEYDEWFYRKGRYDRGEEGNRQWFADAAVVRQALHDFRLEGAVLELAPGTGIWTRELVKSASEVIAVDGSEEMLRVNAAKIGSELVTYEVADLFEWRPSRKFDGLFFGFWLSHVPRERLEWFAELCADCLAPGGKLFFVDSRPDQLMSANEHILPGEGEQVMSRKLNDGRIYEIVKVFYEPAELEEAFGKVGIQLDARKSERFFIYGSGLRQS